MSVLSLQDRVKALNLGLSINGDFDTGRVTVTGGRQTFVFESLEQAGQALDLANYVAFNTLYKMTVGDGPIASLLAKLPRHAGSCSNQNVLDPLGAYKGVEACGCNATPRPTIQELEAILSDESPAKVTVNPDGSVSA